MGTLADPPSGYNGPVLVPLGNWADPKKRRLLAIEAAQNRDEARLLELLEVYLFTKGRKKSATSPETLKTYRVGVRDFLAWAWPEGARGPRVPLLKVGADDLDRWVSELLVLGGHLRENAGPLAPATVQTYLSGVRALYRALAWAQAAELPEGVHAPADPTPREERRPALPLSLYRRLLEHLEGDEPERLRDRALVRLLGEVGLRIGEAVALEVGDLDLDQRLVTIRRGKGGKRRTVPLPESLVADLRRWLSVRRAHALPGELAVFVNLKGPRARGRRTSADMVRKRLNRYYAELGFPRRYHGAHLLRHTAGTRFYRASRDLHLTARLLGHANVNTSAIYAKMDLADLRSLVDRLDKEEGEGEE